jgi:hypothetical protein
MMNWNPERQQLLLEVTYQRMLGDAEKNYGKLLE